MSCLSMTFLDAMGVSIRLSSTPSQLIYECVWLNRVYNVSTEHTSTLIHIQPIPDRGERRFQLEWLPRRYNTPADPSIPRTTTVVTFPSPDISPFPLTTPLETRLNSDTACSIAAISPSDRDPLRPLALAAVVVMVAAGTPPRPPLRRGLASMRPCPTSP